MSFKLLWDKLKKLVFGEKTFSEIVRFLIVGTTVTLFNYGLYLLLLLVLKTAVEGDAAADIAYTIAFVVSLALNLVLTTLFTFKQSFSLLKSGGFLLTHLINYGIRIGLLHLFLWLGMSDKLAPIPVELISTPIQFLLLKFVFKKRSKESSQL